MSEAGNSPDGRACPCLSPCLSTSLFSIVRAANKVVSAIAVFPKNQKSAGLISLYWRMKQKNDCINLHSYKIKAQAKGVAFAPMLEGNEGTGGGMEAHTRRGRKSEERRAMGDDLINLGTQVRPSVLHESEWFLSFDVEEQIPLSGKIDWLKETGWCQYHRDFLLLYLSGEHIAI